LSARVHASDRQPTLVAFSITMEKLSLNIECGLLSRHVARYHGHSYHWK
jgi:hypothetical protein